MAMRRATRTFPDIQSFAEAYHGDLRNGFLVLPAEAVTDEPANPLKLDLMLPVVGRVGPITAQVMSRTPEGGLALRLPELQLEAGKGIASLWAAIDEVKAWLLSSGAVSPAGGGPADAELLARIEVLEAENAVLRDALDTFLDEEAAKPSDEAGQDASEAEGDEDALIDDEELVDDSPESEDDAGEPDAEAPEADDTAGALDDGGPAQPSPAQPAAKAAARGFQVPDLRGRAARISGELGGHAFQDALVTLAADRATGLLTARLPDGRTRYGFWEKGGPVGFRTEPLNEAEVLGVLLLRAQQINEDQLRKSLELMRARGCRQGEAFLDMGVMSYPQLIMVLGKQVEFVFTQVLGAKDGSFTFHDLPALPEPFLPPALRIPNMLFRRSTTRAKELRSDDLAAHFKPNINAYVALHPDARRLLADVKMSDVEKKLVSIISETNLRLREVFTVSPISRANTACIIFALDELRVLQYDGGESRAGYLARVAELIEKKKRQLTRCTEFDVLEVHWISLQEEVEAAHRKVAADFSPSSFKELPAEMLAELAKINERIKTAAHTLRSTDSRREYRKQILEGFMIDQSAELLGRKGEMAIMRHDRREAVACFAKALELVPKNAEYLEGMARAQVS